MMTPEHRNAVVDPPPQFPALAEASERCATGPGETIDGCLDLVTKDLISGWAWDAKNPSESVRLRIMCDGYAIGEVVANLYRKDLKTAGIGSGRHAFEVPVADLFSPTKHHLIAVHRIADGKALLGSPRLLEFPIEPAPSVKRPSAPSPDWTGSKPLLPEFFTEGPGLPLGPVRELRRISIVVGMHRSGTSLCSNLLSELGIDMGDDIDISPTNTRGHWERKEIVRFHDRILRQLERDWYDPRHAISLPAEWWSRPDIRNIRDEIISWLKTRLHRAKLFGFKDPRTARLLPLWDDVCTALNVQAHYVFCIRHPLQVARSLMVRDGIEIWDALYRWLIYNSHAICSIGDRPTRIIPYETWFSHWDENFDRLVSHLGDGASLPGPVAEKIARQVIDPMLRHDHPVTDEFSASLPVVFYRQILQSAQRGRFSREVIERAQSFIMFEEFIQPVMMQAYP